MQVNHQLKIRLNSGKLFSLVCNPSTVWHAFFIDCQKTACQKLWCQYTHAFLHYLPQSRHAFLHYCLKTDMTFYRHDFLHYCQSTGQPQKWLASSFSIFSYPKTPKKHFMNFSSDHTGCQSTVGKNEKFQAKIGKNLKNLTVQELYISKWS